MCEPGPLLAPHDAVELDHLCVLLRLLPLCAHRVLADGGDAHVARRRGQRVAAVVEAARDLAGVRERAELALVHGDAAAPVEAVPGHAVHRAAVPVVGAV